MNNRFNPDYIEITPGPDGSIVYFDGYAYTYDVGPYRGNVPDIIMLPVNVDEKTERTRVRRNDA